MSTKRVNDLPAPNLESKGTAIIMTIFDYVTRTAALSALEAASFAELDATKTKLLAAIEEARTAHDATVSKARAEEAATVVRLEAAHAATARAVFSKLAAAFGDAPRTTAGAFAKAWRDLDARCRTDLGGGLSCKHLAAAVAGAHGLAGRVSGPSFWVFNGTNIAAEKADRLAASMCDPGAIAVVIESAYRELEVAIATSAAKQELDGERSDAMLSVATDGASRAACLAFDEHRAARERIGAETSAATAIAAVAARHREQNERSRGIWVVNAVPAKPTDELFS